MSGKHILHKFQDWFFSPAGPGLQRIPCHDPITSYGSLTATTLYRHNGFQVELVSGNTAQPYKVSLPKGAEIMVIFLGGSLEADSSLWSGNIPSDPAQDSPAPRPQAYFEQPHPSKGRKLLFKGETELTMSFPEENGVLLILEQLPPNEVRSCLRYFQKTMPVT